MHVSNIYEGFSFIHTHLPLLVIPHKGPVLKKNRNYTAQNPVIHHPVSFTLTNWSQHVSLAECQQKQQSRHLPY